MAGPSLDLSGRRQHVNGIDNRLKGITVHQRRYIIWWHLGRVTRVLEENLGYPDIGNGAESSHDPGVAEHVSIKDRRHTGSSHFDDNARIPRGAIVECRQKGEAGAAPCGLPDVTNRASRVPDVGCRADTESELIDIEHSRWHQAPPLTPRQTAGSQLPG